MNSLKFVLLAAAAASSIAAGAAQAQVAIPAPGPNDGDSAIHGAGASSIQNVLVQELNCIGGANRLGVSSPNPNGALNTVAEPTNLPGGFNCATQEIQPNFRGKYVSTGSGFGRQAWRLASAQFAPVTVDVNNPFEKLNGEATWTGVQFAFSDTGLSPSDLTAYNNTTTGAVSKGGAAISFPKYVLPVAIAYNPVYGRNASAADMRFNVATAKLINGVNVGGLPMSRVLYCRVFNGEITNFNDPAFATANGGTSLRDTTNDTAARWASDGVPIRLVGRLDRSGTTDIFTRHLASVCGGLTTNANKYLNNAESLPYARGASTSPNFSSVRSDTGYSPTSTAPVAGTTNLVSGDYFNGTAIVNVGGASSSPVGNAGSGLYLLGDGSGKVRDAINFAPDYALNGVTLNGKIGYIASDFIANSPTGSATLFAAALQEGGTGSTYSVPSAARGVAAFGTGSTAILPPQSNGSGVYTSTDSRIVRLPGGGTGTATRQNPLAWTDVLYGSANDLSKPVAGYPITGTTQFFGYTCYKASNRQNVAEFLALNFGQISQDSDGAAITRGIFNAPTGTTLGLLAQSNIGVVPGSWQTALTETFLTDSSQTSGGTRLGSLNLWLQNSPTPSTTTTSNSTCATLPGA